MARLSLHGLKIALVYDRVNKWGGAERLLLSLKKVFPDAPLFTSLYNPQTSPWADKFHVHSSFLNKLKPLRTRHEFVPFLMPFAFESFDFSDFDLVISVTSAEAKGIISKPKTLHVCYCLTPTRYLYLKSWPFFSHILMPLKKWDLVASRRPDAYISISRHVKERVRKFYGQDSPVIYPPLDPLTVFPRPAKKRSYFLIVTRLVPYKRVDLAIKVANKLKLNLKIAGSGRDFDRLKKIAGNTVEFLGFVPEQKIPDLYALARAVIIPGEEDFCLTSIEAQANNTPVIAYRQGGVKETVIDGKTGLLFDYQSEKLLEKALVQFSRMDWDPAAFKQNTSRYSQAEFSKKFIKTIEGIYEKYQRKLRN